MSYASLIKTLPRPLRSSTGVAALTSLGIHGVLLAVLPGLPLESKSANQSQRTVGLVELTPAEQSRLPQVNLPPFATQPSVLPPLPQPPATLNMVPPSGMTSVPPQLSVLPSLPQPPALNIVPPSGTPVPPLSSVSPSLPQIPDTALSIPPSSSTPISQPPSLSNLPNVLPSLPPPPEIQLPPPSPPPASKYPIALSLPQPQTFPVPPLPPSGNNQSVTRQIAISKQPYVDNPVKYGQGSRVRSPKLPRLAAASVPDEFRSSTSRFIPQENINQLQNQEATRRNLGTLSATTSAGTGKLPAKGREELLALRQKIRESAKRGVGTTSQQLARTIARTKPLATSSQPEIPAPRQDQILALRQKLRESAKRNASTTSQQLARAIARTKPLTTSSQPENIPAPRQDRLVTLQQRLRAQSTHLGSTSPATAEKISQLRVWAKREATVQENHSNVITKAPIYKTRKTCQKELDNGVAVLGVVVNPDGKIVSGPDLLDKKGSPVVEQAAKKYVRGYPFSKTDNPTNQQFRLQFKYDTDNCSQANRNSTPKNTDTQQPKS